MNRRMLAWVLASLIVSGTVTSLAFAGPVGVEGDRQVRIGSCDGPSSWRLEVRREEPGRLRIRYRIEGGKPGQKWHLNLSDNGKAIALYLPRMSQEGGVVRLRRYTEDLRGPDAIKASGLNLVTHELCRARLDFGRPGPGTDVGSRSGP